MSYTHRSYASDPFIYLEALSVYSDSSPQLVLDQSPIPMVDETTFLGVIFDSRLSFVPHHQYVKKKGLKALNILKVIGSTEWGADRKVMLRLYISLVRSKLDYGCVWVSS